MDGLRPSHSEPSRDGVELRRSALFDSFWMGGFESACQINAKRQRIDMIAATQHDVQALHDYRLVRQLGIRTVRDAVRWHLIERKPGQYDFAALAPLAEAAQQEGVQVIWTLCHYGWPDDLDLFSAQFVNRFARYARAVAAYLLERSDAPLFISPINEISYFAWAIGTGCVFYPYTRGLDQEIKRQLVRASIAAIDAIREVDPRTRFVQPDPMIHVVPPAGRPDLEHAAAAHRAGQFQAWDMLAGRIEPGLGGGPQYLDIVGVNFYHVNQWEHLAAPLNWNHGERDPRWIPLHRLLKECHDRYQRPLVLTETSHVGEGRPAWMRDVATEVLRTIESGVPLEGVCLYPIIDRPDWDDEDWWHNSGLFDLQRTEDGRLERVCCSEYACEFERARRLCDR